jgi:hypothetical protein
MQSRYWLLWFVKKANRKLSGLAVGNKQGKQNIRKIKEKRLQRFSDKILYRCFSLGVQSSWEQIFL